MPFSERLSSFSCSIDALLLNNLDTPQGPTDRGRATLHWSLQRLVAYLDVFVNLCLCMDGKFILQSLLACRSEADGTAGGGACDPLKVEETPGEGGTEFSSNMRAAFTPVDVMGDDKGTALFAASLVSDEQRARIVGIVLSGILIGVLLARVVSGFVGAEWGWRAMYGIAAGLMLLLALVLWRALPKQPSSGGVSYPQLLASLWNIVCTEPALRSVCLFGGLTFAAFNVFWVTLAFFLKTPPYHFGSDIVGLFGIVGVVGAIAAPQVGKLADRTGKPRITIGLGLSIVLLAFVVFWLCGYTLWGLIVGVILLDLGTQTNLISCQAIAQSLRPQARSRLNTIFMTTYFLGGAAGSTLGSYGWSLGRWDGICMIGVGLVLSALMVFLLTSRSTHR